MPSSSQTEFGTKAIGSNIFSRNFDSYGVAKHTINTGASEKAVAYGPKERVSNFPAFSSPFSAAFAASLCNASHVICSISLIFSRFMITKNSHVCEFVSLGA